MNKYGVTEIVGSLLSIVDKVMDFLPNYEEKKKNEFRKLRAMYEDEKKKDYMYRDDNLVGIYRDKLLIFIEIFKKDLEK